MGGKGSDAYLYYLIDIVDGISQESLLRRLFSMPFYYDPQIVFDANTAENAKELRIKYLNETGFNSGMSGDANVLEVLIHIAIKMEEIMCEPENPHPERWFWEMINNLGLFEGNGIEGRVMDWMDRVYSKDGRGSIFPLMHTYPGYKRLSIWEQAGLYMSERV